MKTMSKNMMKIGLRFSQEYTLSLKLKLKTRVREYSEFDSSKTELRIGSRIS